MKKNISFKLLVSVLAGGIRQLFRGIGKLFGYTDRHSLGKVVWRISATCLSVLLVIYTGTVLCAFADEIIYDKWIKPHTNPNVLCDRHISNGIAWQDIEYGDGRIYDEINGRVILNDVDWVVVSDDKDSLAVYSRKGRRGYINRFTGELAIPEIYTRAWVFSEGLAAVEKDGELMFIDHSGNVMIDRDFEVCFNNPEYVFKNGYCTIMNPATGKSGLIDRNGDFVIKDEYDLIVYNAEGFWLVWKDSRTGLYTADMEVMFPVDNTHIAISDGVIEVRGTDHIARQYDYDGNVLVDFVIDGTSNMRYETTELRNDFDYPNIASEYGNPYEYYEDSECDESVVPDDRVYGIADCLRYVVWGGGFGDYYYGLLDRSGRVITPPIYTSIEAIGKNLYFCKPQGVIVNNRGEVVK